MRVVMDTSYALASKCHHFCPGTKSGTLFYTRMGNKMPVYLKRLFIYCLAPASFNEGQGHSEVKLGGLRSQTAQT